MSPIFSILLTCNVWAEKRLTPLSTQEQQLQRWREHFYEILNREQEQETQRQVEET
jgi:hypothetical protein